MAVVVIAAVSVVVVVVVVAAVVVALLHIASIQHQLQKPSLVQCRALA